ncbi:serine/threonine protein kinase [Candidatus Bathyarchaeota archaeon]|nr:MAG: serine/threonine protein kinase [Candidatus Bathyarchaeota archaeon]
MKPKSSFTISYKPKQLENLLLVEELNYYAVMSSADIAVKIYRKLHPLDISLLRAIELLMAKHEYVPEVLIAKKAKLSLEEAQHRLQHLSKNRLIRKWRGPYVGYVLNMAGYDVLAINAFVKANVLEAFGKPLGIGKEADVYDALTPNNRRVAVKFHRLGRTSFRQTRRKRDYVAERYHISWLYQSRLAAKKEFQALKLLYPAGVAVPEPIKHNRHAIVMGMIEGAELYRYKEIPEPKQVFTEILKNVRKAYLEAGVIHADLSEYNVILQPDMHVLIIDWPQYVTKDHPNANELLGRDLKNILKFFRKRRLLNASFSEVFEYVVGRRSSVKVTEV